MSQKQKRIVILSHFSPETERMPYLFYRASAEQERLIKNKSLLNVVEPTLENTPLEVLLGILQQRIELDKECLFQFTQIKKDMKLDGGGGGGGEKGAGGKAKAGQGGGHSVAPVLMRYQRGCQQVGNVTLGLDHYHLGKWLVHKFSMSKMTPRRKS